MTGPGAQPGTWPGAEPGTGPPTPPQAPPGRRTSPRIVAVHTATFRQARQLVPALIPVAAVVGFDDGLTTVVVLAVAITALSLAAAALSWWRFSYADGPTAVVVTRGLLARSVRTVPNDRIRGVEVETPLLHRLFGLVRVRVDAAAGSVGVNEEEVVVDGVPRAEGDRLRESLLARRGSAPGHASAPADGVAEELPEEEFARFDNRWLLYAPLVGSYLVVPLAAVGTLFRFLDELPDGLVPRLDGPDLSDVQVVVVAVVLAAVLLALAAVVGAAVVNWRFRLVRRGGSLVAVRGLLTRRHTELEVDRIRGGTLSEGLGMRWVGAARVNALVTGLGQANRRGQLLPLGPRSEAEALLRRLADDPGVLRSHPPAALRRRLVRAVSAGLLLTSAGGIATATLGWWWVLAAGVALTVLSVPMGIGRYRSLGHAAGPRTFSVRSGWLVREQAVLQRRAVVGWQVRQSVSQRRQGVATVVACVGAGSGGYAAVDLAAGDVAGFTGAASSGTWAGTLAP
ncbi:PH domain-containing protein [Geodermatophilus sabuli]|uniref:Putative membrane protein n=1 Tax=Geodermatophilus sabuli TaxID=1564158 RepID=A0A285EIQ7_9ACTN|nr:PH domain-containing protein [Geodermatophilus sabuli]MBB3086747.1 putative membrane protein [Geodermatophilus sabuli]SNX98877.1 putative membrane protein [Geodermatophilus sabuli]